MTAHSETSPLTDYQLAFIEQLAGFSKQVGLPKSTFRVVGFLAICQPPAQSARSIQLALGLSAGSVSTATTFLTKMKLVERVKLPGDRQYYYRLNPDGFVQAMELRLLVLAQAKALVEGTLANEPANRRLSKWRDFYAIEEAEILAALTRLKTPDDP